jgi:hypothetical protein
MTERSIALLSLISAAGCAVFAGCGGDDPPPDTTPTKVTLTGKVSDAAGRAVSNATVEVGAVSAITNFRGQYELVDLPTGAATLKVKALWFIDAEQAVQIASGVTADVTLQAKPLDVLPADRAIADAYNATFDWTAATISVSYVPRPTRADVDFALYYRNPALYRDAVGTSSIAPSPRPEITASAANFVFDIPAGSPSAGQPALDTATIVDAISGTPLSQTEIERAILWEPAELYLVKWNATEARPIHDVGLAIAGQNWGATPPFAAQHLEHLYLHGNELWVELVFEPWLAVGPGITDDDGDGYKEVYARITPALAPASVVQQLVDDYLAVSYDALELQNNLAIILNDLYGRTLPSILSVIGVPFEVPGHGTIQYPFVVLRHADGDVNVLLVEP